MTASGAPPLPFDLLATMDTPTAAMDGVGECLRYALLWQHEALVSRLGGDHERADRCRDYAGFWIDALRA